MGRKLKLRCVSKSAIRFVIFHLLLVLLLCEGSVKAQTPAQEFERAEKSWDNEDYAAAESHFSSALKLSPDKSDDQAHAYFGRGLARLQQEKWESARDDLTASIELNPHNAEAFASRGMARKALGDYDGLLADAHQAVAIDPQYYAGFEEAAKSTVNWRRLILGSIILGCIVATIGLVPMVRSFARVIKGEAQARRKT